MSRLWRQNMASLGRLATFAKGPTTAQRNLTNGRFTLRWTRCHELGAPPEGDHSNEQSDALAAHAVQR
jgi:hypothetical protein